jgi:5-methylcytosine-specific restriction endonuclease McrBC regulatory subunit McrC
MGESNIKIQETEYPEVSEYKLKVRIDIEVLQNGAPALILDTKYREFENMPDEGHVAQLILYSLSTGVKKSGLIYVGRLNERHKHIIKSGITLYVLCFNLISLSTSDFSKNCLDFTEEVRSILSD